MKQPSVKLQARLKRTVLRSLSRLMLIFIAIVLLESCKDNAPQTLVAESPVIVIIESRIAVSTDDAEEYTIGSVTRSSTKLEFVDSSSSTNQTVGLRFPNLALPKGAAITNAYLQFKASGVSSDVTSLTIQAQASDNAITFGSTSFGISTRSKLPASVSWSPVAWSVNAEAGLNQRSPDLTALVKAIVDQPGWASGNALAFIITGSGKRVAFSFDGDPASAPLLHVEYTTDDSPPVISSFTDAPDIGDTSTPMTFNWTVSDPQSQLVSCTLDINSDGTAEYTLPDCVSTSSQQHTYSTPGNYTATLTATDSDNVSVTAITNVVIGTYVTVAAAGDIACRHTSDKFNGGLGTPIYCHMLATSNMILGMNPDAVLALGDNQYEEGTFDQFMNSYDLSWGRLKPITRPAVGNHEYLTANAAGHFQYFGSAAGDPAKGYYSFNLGNWHIIALNSNCSKVGGCGVGSPQETWLKADLIANPTACTLAYWHHPRFSSGAIGGNTAYTAFWNALQNAGAEIVLVGHDHNYERFAPQNSSGAADPNGLREFVVGTGGKNFTSIATVQPNSEVRKDGVYGILKLELHPTSYTWEFVSESGYSFTDSGTQNCR
jgi:acid phosphatase type 7